LLLLLLLLLLLFFIIINFLHIHQQVGTDRYHHHHYHHHHHHHHHHHQLGLELAANAAITTQICASVAAFTWMLTEWIFRKQPSVLGLVNGAIAGLVCITPACGYVDTTAAFIIGFIGGPLCYFGAQVKHYVGIDDALDAFGVHAIGGIIGGIATGFFANPDIYDNANGVIYSPGVKGGYQLAYQLAAITFTILWSSIISYISLLIIDKFIVLRVTAEDEEIGLDKTIHNETIEKSQHSQNPNNEFNNFNLNESKNSFI